MDIKSESQKRRIFIETDDSDQKFLSFADQLTRWSIPFSVFQKLEFLTRVTISKFYDRNLFNEFDYHSWANSWSQISYSIKEIEINQKTFHGDNYEYARKPFIVGPLLDDFASFILLQNLVNSVNPNVLKIATEQFKKAQGETPSSFVFSEVDSLCDFLSTKAVIERFKNHIKQTWGVVGQLVKEGSDDYQIEMSQHPFITAYIATNTETFAFLIDHIANNRFVPHEREKANSKLNTFIADKFNMQFPNTFSIQSDEEAILTERLWKLTPQNVANRNRRYMGRPTRGDATRRKIKKIVDNLLNKDFKEFCIIATGEKFANNFRQTPKKNR